MEFFWFCLGAFLGASVGFLTCALFADGRDEL